MKRIDCEFHYYIPELFDYLAKQDCAPRYFPKEKIFEQRTNVKANFAAVTNSRSLVEELTDFGESRLRDMDRCGIDTAVMGVSPIIEELPKEASVSLARKSNDAVAKLIEKYPGRFIGAAALPTIHLDEAIKELERCIKELGFAYWHTHSNYRNEHLYDRKFLPLLEKAAELDCPFYMHPHCSDDADMKDMGYVYSAPGLGFGLDAMKTSMRLILNGTFDRFPNLVMILGHLGEYYPYIMDRIDNRFAWIKDKEVTMQHPLSYYFKKRNVVVTTSGNAQKSAFCLCKEVLGIDSIIFGSDYPYENLKDMTDFINSLVLTEEEKEKLWHGNAERLLLKNRK